MQVLRQREPFRLPYHNIAIVYCNDRILCAAVVLVVAVHENCNTLPYIIFSGSDAGISGLVGIFPFAFAIKMTSCWDLSASASMFDIPIPGPLQYASFSLLCCFYRSSSGFICAHSASSPCSPPIPFWVTAPAFTSRPIFLNRHCSLLSLALCASSLIVVLPIYATKLLSRCRTPIPLFGPPRSSHRSSHPSTFFPVRAMLQLQIQTIEVLLVPCSLPVLDIPPSSSNSHLFQFSPLFIP
jgi:hypothetical protein